MAKTTVVGVAHQDDDLLFINPTLEADFAAGISNSAPTPWTSSNLSVGGQTLTSVHLETGANRPNIQLVFLRMPDGNPEWRATPASATRAC